MKKGIFYAFKLYKVIVKIVARRRNNCTRKIGNDIMQNHPDICTYRNV